MILLLLLFGPLLWAQMPLMVLTSILPLPNLPDPSSCRDAPNIQCALLKQLNNCHGGFMRMQCKSTCGLCIRNVSGELAPRGHMALTDAQVQEMVEYAAFAGEANDHRENMLQAHFQNNKERADRVEDGRDATLDEAPWFVQLTNFSDFSRCGAVAISSHCVLTVAHCVLDTKINNRNFQARIGSVTSYNGQTIRIRKMIPYESGRIGDRVEACSEYDIMLLLTKDEIEPGRRLNLATQHETPGRPLNFYRFGAVQIAEGGAPVTISRMQRGEVIIKPNRFTNRKHLFITTGKLHDGDSGGPLVWYESAVPVVGGLYCGQVRQDGEEMRLFMRVKDYSGWIHQKLWEELHDSL